MAITQQETPSTRMFVENHIVLQMQSDAFYTQAAIKTGFEIEIGAAIPVTNNLDFEIVDSDAKVETVNLVFPDGAFDATHLAEIESYLENESNLYYFDFEIVAPSDPADPYEIHFSSDSDITVQNFSSNFATATIIASQALILKDNFFINLELWIKGIDWNNLVLQHSLTTDGQATFLIQNILKDEILNKKIELPSPTALSFSQLFAEYFYKSYEVDNGTVGTKTKSAFFKAHLGGLKKGEFALNGNYFDDIDINNSFLTGLETQYIHKDQEQFICLFNHMSDKNIVVQFRYDNGTWIDKFTTALPEGEILIIPVGLAAHSTAESVNYFEVRVKEQNAQVLLSNHYFFYVDNRDYEFTKEILYFNRFGVPVILLTKGLWEYRTKITKQTSERILEANYDAQTFETFDYDHDKDYMIKATSGYFRNSEEATEHSDLFSSPFVFLKEDARWKPVIVNQSEVTTQQDKVNLQGFDFEIQIAL